MVDVADRKAKRIPGHPAPTKRKLKRTIGPCEGCGLHDVQGCGWLGKRSMREYVHADEHMPDVSRTCPEYYARMPAVVECYDHLQDYKRGAMGNVLDLPAPLLDGLRVLEGEHGTWEGSLSE